MKSRGNNHAYIDGANLHKGIDELGWALDYRRFRQWLADKYAVSRAYFFIGLIPKNKNLYTFLQEAGYMLVFKDTTYDGEGKTKGNCDADLVLKAVADVYENTCDQAVLVTGDGDFASLVSMLLAHNKLKVILAPHHKKCSILLKRTRAKITFLEEFREKLAKKEKTPGKDSTLQGSFS